MPETAYSHLINITPLQITSNHNLINDVADVPGI